MISAARCVPALLAISALAPRLVAQSAPSMREVIELYSEDQGSLRRTYSTPTSPERRERLRRFQEQWLARVDALDFDALDRDSKADWILLRNEIRHALALLDREAAREAEVAPLLASTPPLVALFEARRRFERVDPPRVAERLQEIADATKTLREELSKRPAEDFAPTLANRAVKLLGRLRDALGSWFRFYDGYDPAFTWWATAPEHALDHELDELAKLVKERFVHAESEDALLGDPIGREALLQELAFEFVPYTPEELVAVAEREFAWCDERMLEASRELGYGDDWRAAQDHVADLYVEPGKQPELIRELAVEATEFVEARELLTVPPLAKETWRMEMMSPERQKTSPYFLGGETIQVSYPTASMEQADKLMSLRGNNEHFARATVFHEVIPGHHLQGFMNERHRPYRRLFDTPFSVEGWALYWEMRMWDLGFARGPEDRIGMLFWRKHRCARIVFSLSFHLGTMSAEECVDYLVERVGHERRNAEAEVRRSISGDYGPLYQCAYLLGGLQYRRLHGELVGSGAFGERAFHDAVLERNAIPVAVLRASLTDAPMERDFGPGWRFAD